MLVVLVMQLSRVKRDSGRPHDKQNNTNCEHVGFHGVVVDALMDSWVHVSLGALVALTYALASPAF